MSSSSSRSVTPVQLVALLLAFLSVAGLTGVLGAGLLVPAVGSAAVVVKTAPTILDGLPTDLQVVEPAEESTMLDAKGNVIARFYDRRRIVVPSDKIADTMKSAIVSIEDKRFYQHHGVDPDGIARALVNNLTDDSGGQQGASTITQQYVRNMLVEKGYLDGDPELITEATEPTTQRKLREMKYALTLETEMSKDQILTGYLNIAPFGPTTYGVEAAARLYFSDSAASLDWNQAALLAGLVQSPVEYDPLVHPEAAQTRRDTVLDVMLQQGVITQEEHDKYIATPVSQMLKPNVTSEGCSGASSQNAYFCDYALEEFLNDSTYGKSRPERLHMLKTAGITIRTTLDPDKQTSAHNSLVSAIPVDDASGLDDALASIEPSTGKILAMTQNSDYGVGAGQTMSNYSADGQFQVGSTFKIFTLIEWFKEGHSAYESVGRASRNYYQTEFHCSNGQSIIYTPNPYPVEDLAGKDGPMTVLRATGLSVNQAFVNMSTKLDFCNIFQDAADMGITQSDGSVIKAIPSNIIGSGESSPLKMASVAATLSNDGVQCAAQSLDTVTDRDEKTLKEYRPSCKKVLDSTVAQQVSTLLTKSTSQYYTSTRIADGRQFAAKSGTTNGNSNTWLTGWTPQLATSAWVGHADASSTPVNNVTINGTFYEAIYGETFVGQNIWAPYMSSALSGTEAVAMPNVFIGNQVTPQPTTSPSTRTGTTQGGTDTQGGNQGGTDTQGGNQGNNH